MQKNVTTTLPRAVGSLIPIYYFGTSVYNLLKDGIHFYITDVFDCHMKEMY